MKFVIFAVLSLAVAAFADVDTIGGSVVGAASTAVDTAASALDAAASAVQPPLDESSATSLKQSLGNTLTSLKTSVQSKIDSLSASAQNLRVQKLNILKDEIVAAESKLSTLTPSTQIGQSGLQALKSLLGRLETRVNAQNSPKADLLRGV